MCRSSASSTSRQVGLRAPARSHGHGPRLYDLRHRLAVTTLMAGAGTRYYAAYAELGFAARDGVLAYAGTAGGSPMIMRWLDSWSLRIAKEGQ